LNLTITIGLAYRSLWFNYLKIAVIWAIDALQPFGHGTLLYVLYEVLSSTPVSGIQLQQAQTQQLIEWLQPYQELLLHCVGNLVRWGKINHRGNEFNLDRCTTSTLSGTLSR